MLLEPAELLEPVVLVGLPLAVSYGALAEAAVVELDSVVFGYLLLAVGGLNGVSGAEVLG